MTDQPTKQCRVCKAEKPLIAFAGRQNTCIQCRDAAKARTQERKEAIQYSDTIATRITEAVSAGMTLSEIAGQAWAPTLRQMVAWRRTHPDWADALDAARAERADVRSDRVDQALNDLRAGKISAADCRVIVEAELKLARVEAPNRYVEPTKSEVSAEVHSNVTNVNVDLIPDRRDLARAVVEILRSVPLDDIVSDPPPPLAGPRPSWLPPPTSKPPPVVVEDAVIENAVVEDAGVVGP
jgi:hypothetical protein